MWQRAAQHSAQRSTAQPLASAQTSHQHVSFLSSPPDRSTRLPMERLLNMPAPPRPPEPPGPPLDIMAESGMSCWGGGGQRMGGCGGRATLPTECSQVDPTRHPLSPSYTATKTRAPRVPHLDKVQEL